MKTQKQVYDSIRKPIAPPSKVFKTKKEKIDSKHKYSYEDELYDDYGDY